MSTNVSLACRASRWRQLKLGVFIAIACSAAVPHPTANALGPQDRRLNNARTGISLEAPAGWTLSQHTGYSDTVALLLHPDGSRISITAASTTAADAGTLLKQNRPGFAAQGLQATPAAASAGRGTVAIDLTGAGRPDRMRQLYIVRAVPRGHQAIVLTLVSPLKAFSARLAALDFVAARLTLDDPLPSSRPSRSGATGGNSGTATARPR